MQHPLIVGNWKMNGTLGESSLLARKVRRGLKGLTRAEVVLAPPFTALIKVREAIRGSRIQLAGQNLHWESRGAFTGEVSADMLKDVGCRLVIVGHSERRHLFHESDETIAKKVVASLNAGLKPILCVGETLAERQSGRTNEVIERQLGVALKGFEKSVIRKIEFAYEPVWAIGTGHNATPDQASEVHAWIRDLLEKQFGTEEALACRILYGGSVKAENAGELMKAVGVNGLLVGGASLKAEEFLQIIRRSLS